MATFTFPRTATPRLSLGCQTAHLVCTNRLSASASEIFAAALQDLQPLAVIVGDSSTFGKGTVQTMLEDWPYHAVPRRRE